MKKVFLSVTLVLVAAFAFSGMAEAGFYGPLGGYAVVFPYVIKDDPNTTTIISVVVPDPDGSSDDAAELHYVYLHKDIAAAQTDACEEYNFKGHTSPNDLVTFDAGGMFGDEPGKEGYPLFNDTTSDPLSAGSPLSLVVEKQIGYLLVELLNEDNEPAGSLNWPPDGEALILDIANGGAWGYKASSNFWYHDEQAWLFKSLAAPALVNPPSIATTEFTVTPFSQGIIGNSGSYSSALLTNQMAVIQPVANEDATAAVFDRNENTLSATKEKKVTCVGVATLDELLGSGILNNPAFVAQGGWGWLWNKPFDVDGDGDVEVTPGCPFFAPGCEQNEAFVFKVESSSALGSFMINAVPQGGFGITPGLIMSSQQ